MNYIEAKCYLIKLGGANISEHDRTYGMCRCVRQKIITLIYYNNMVTRIRLVQGNTKNGI